MMSAVIGIAVAIVLVIAIIVVVLSVFGSFANFMAAILELVTTIAWSIEKFIMGIMEALEYLGKSLLGIGTTLDDYTEFANANNLTETFVKTFKALAVVAIVLMIVFTIIANFRQEYANISSGKFNADGNKKGPLIMKLFRGVMSIIVLPITMILIIGGLNSVLTSFAVALNGGKTTTVAANMLSLSSYDANKYRRYANANKRVPIIIEAYCADDYGPDESTKYYNKIASTQVQDALYSIGNQIKDVGNSEFLSFKDSLTYENNQLSNSSTYGDIYESFVCTAEQYQVMAEFIDYAQLSQQEFYIRSVDDDYIEWKYVDTAIFDRDSKSLTINYKNASEIDCNGTTSDTYTITYSMGFDVSSPISNALETIKALLGIGEKYSDNKYNTMERDENSINMVQWENEKTSLHFSKDFDQFNSTTWTASDQILMFEYYHYASNNDFSEYDFSRLKYAEAVTNGKPITSDVYILTYRDYYASTDTYSDEKKIYCTLINGNYYIVEKSTEEMDEYGNYYYNLKPLKEDLSYDPTNGWTEGDVKFLASTYRAIYEYSSIASDGTKNDYTYLKLSQGFDINNTSTWTYTDQIIMYEYYKDLSYINNLSVYQISDFKYDKGVALPTYVISEHTNGGTSVTSEKANKYVFINGTYYQVEHKTNCYELAGVASGNFIDLLSTSSKSFYNYQLYLKEYQKYGISTDSAGHKADDYIIASTDSSDNSNYFQKQFYYYSIETESTYTPNAIPKYQKDQMGNYILANGSIVSVSDYTPEMGERVDSGEKQGYTTFKAQLKQDDFEKAFQSASEEKYEKFKIKFSSTFDYTDSSTWTYRDYFILYLYAKYLSPSGNITIEQLMTDQGISGTLGRIGKTKGTSASVGNSYSAVISKIADEDFESLDLTDDEKQTGITEFEYLFKIDTSLTNYTYDDNGHSVSKEVTVYLKLEDIMNISEKNIENDFDLEKTFTSNDFDLTKEDTLIIDTYNLIGTSVTFSKSETENRKFKFSSAFLYTDISTWTMEDFLLLLLDQTYVGGSRVINIAKTLNSSSSDLSNLNLTSFEYSSLVYTYNDPTSEMNGKHIYSFDGKIYLNEDYFIRSTNGGLGYATFDYFLSAKVMDVLKNVAGSKNLTADTETFINQLFVSNNLSTYVKNSNTALLNNLVGEYIYGTSSPLLETSLKLTQATYQNENFDYTDISTWSKFDLLVYLLTGSVSGGKNSYDVLTTNGSDKYIVIGDKAVNIRALDDNASINYTAKIEAKELSGVTDQSSAKNYYYNTSKLQSEIKIVSSDKLTVKENMKYKYISYKNQNKYSYLDTLLIGVKDDSDYKIVENYTSQEIEFYIYQIDEDTNSNYSYICLGTLSNGSSVLYKLDEYAVSPNVSKTSSSSISFTDANYFKKVVESIDNSTGTDVEIYKTYTSFESLYAEEGAVSDNYTITSLDALIYNYTGKLNQEDYVIYSDEKNSGYSYITIFNSNKINIIEYKDEYVTKFDLADNIKSLTNSEKDIIITNLYNNYYSKYIISSLSGTSDTFEAKINVDFDANDSTKWTPLKIILYKNSLIESKSGEIQEVKAQYTTNKYGEYLIFEGQNQTFNIKVSDFIMDEEELEKSEVGVYESFSVIVPSEDTTNKTEVTKLSNTKTRMMFYNAFIVKEGTDKFNEKINYINYFSNYATYVKSKTASDFQVSMSELKSGNAYTFDLDSITTWNFFDMIYYYLFQQTNSETTYTRYYSNGNQYIIISNETDKYYLRVNENDKNFFKNTFVNIGTTGVKTFDFTNSTINSFSLINYYYTGENSQDFTKYKYNLVSSDLFVYSFNNYYIVGLSESAMVSRGGNSSHTGTYTYTSNAVRNNIAEWTLFDLILKEDEGNSAIYSKNYSGSIIDFGGVSYFTIGDTSYNCNALDLNIGADNKITCSTKFLDKLATNLGSNISSITNATKGIFTATDGLKGKFEAYRSGNSSSDDDESFIKLYFSSSFNFSDITTWTLSDYLIYYIFESAVENDSYKNFSINSGNKNFQYYVNQGYVPATIFTVIFESDGSGISSRKGLVIGNHLNHIDAKTENYITVDYTMIYELYGKKLNKYTVFTDKDEHGDVKDDYTHTIDMVITGTSKDNPVDQKFDDFGIKFDNSITTGDFVYNNYYYFNIPSSYSKLYELHPELEVNTDTEKLFYTGELKLSPVYVNLKLSTNFDITDVDTWTILDYIILRAYTEDTGTNMFMGLSYSDLKTANFFVQLYTTKDNASDHPYILKMNGRLYNLTEFKQENSNEILIDEKINSVCTIADENRTNTERSNAYITKSSILDAYDYSFKVLESSNPYKLDDSRYSLTTKVQNTDSTVSYDMTAYVQYSAPNTVYISQSETSGYTEKVVTFHRSLNSETYFNYQLSLTRYKDYTLSPSVLEVNWPQKLMNDMQVIYPDLNWSTLIATDGWLDTLGDYHSGTASGIYVQSGNSANITAVGMVLSEFFLSKAKEVDPTVNYSNFVYETVFDEETLDALMLATMGEKNYYAVKLEASVFVDMFNTGFAAILDDVAADRGIEILDGKVSSLTMSVYKAYLATAILSSDLGEYLYTVATRVYAQYTIYESFAKASGDTANYYAYINGLTDENGEKVDAFSYSSFEELVEYENKFIGDENDIPMFTFNKIAVNNAMRKDGTIGSGDTASTKEMINYLSNKYKSNYVGSAGLESQYKHDSNDSLYCFILDVYYSISQNLKLRNIKDFNYPTYLKIFKNWIDGKMNRWNYVKEASISGGSVYVQNYNKYKAKRVTNFGLLLSSYLVMNLPDVTGAAITNVKNTAGMIADALSGDGDDALQKAKNIFESMKSLFNGETKVDKIKKVFENTEYYDALSEMFPKNDITALWKQITLYKDSEDGVDTAWETINNRYEILGEIISEFSKVMELENYGDKTELGAVKISGVDYDNLFNNLSNYYKYLGSYIGAQNIIDTAEKTAITFTLAQYANNFVADGFEFTIKNKTYQFDSTISAQRLAEYVYGGKFLTQFGVNPSYTNEDFEGMISVSTAYDSSSGLAKKQINSFSNLRQFAREIADYSGKLYTITNMNDLSDNSNDTIKMTEDIYIKNPFAIDSDGGTVTGYLGSGVLNKYFIKANLSYLILDYIIENEYMPLDTMFNLLVAESDIESIVSEMRASNIFVDTSYECLSSFSNSTHERTTKVLALREYLLYTLTTTSTAKYATSSTERTTEAIGTTTNGNTTITVTDTNVITVEVKNSATEESPEGIYGYYTEHGYTGTYSTVAVNSDEGVTAGDRSYTILKKFIKYLTGFDETTVEMFDKNGNQVYFSGSVDIVYDSGHNELDLEGDVIYLTDLNFKLLKNVIMDSLIEYEEYENATGEENTQRYLTLFYLISGEFNYYTSSSNYKGAQTGDYSAILNSEIKVGRVINGANKLVDRESENYNNVDAICYRTFGTDYYLRAGFRIDAQTQAMILKLAGINNRPIEELVNLEYNDLYNKNGYYDEADGDTFILCTYNESEGLFYPVLATGDGYSRTDSFREFSNLSYALTFETEYYDKTYAYPVVAKGIMDSMELPTAIKMVNGDVQFYRTYVTTSGSISEDSLQTANVSTDVTTVNYTNYVNIGTFNSGNLSSKDSKAMYSGANAKELEIKSDANTLLVQYTMNYTYEYPNDLSGVAVLDNFKTFFNINFSDSSMFHILLLVGFMIMIPVLFKVVVAAMRRIFDLMFLILAGPLAIATDSISYQDKHGKTYTMWKEKTEKALLSAFGLVISISIYYVLMYTIMNMTFVTAGDATMRLLDANSAVKAIKNWKLMRFLVEPTFINLLVKLTFVFVASGLIEVAANMIGKITTGGRVENAFNSQLSDTDTVQEMTKFAKDAANYARIAAKIYSGEILEFAKHAMIEKAKRMIPGSAFIQKGVQTAKNIKNKAVSRNMKQKAIDQGVNPAIAKKYSKEYYENTKKIAQAKRKEHYRKANAFVDTMSQVTGNEAKHYDNVVDNAPLLGRVDDKTKAKKDKKKAKKNKLKFKRPKGQKDPNKKKDEKPKDKKNKKDKKK